MAKRFKRTRRAPSTKIAIVMCTWQRIENLRNTIRDLSKQKFKDFHFYIWNNSTKVQAIDSIIKKHSWIKVHHSPKNIGGVGRFYYSKRISRKYEYMLFIDDDQRFGPAFVKQMYSYAKPREIASTWGWVMRSYFDRRRVQNLGEVNYCGTGGMICDAELFHNIDLNELPEEYRFIEDLWLSFYAKYKRGYKLRGCQAQIVMLKDNKGQYPRLLSKKEPFFAYLTRKYVKKNWMQPRRISRRDLHHIQDRYIRRRRSL